MWSKSQKFVFTLYWGASFNIRLGIVILLYLSVKGYLNQGTGVLGTFFGPLEGMVLAVMFEEIVRVSKKAVPSNMLFYPSTPLIFGFLDLMRVILVTSFLIRTTDLTSLFLPSLYLGTVVVALTSDIALLVIISRGWENEYVSYF